MMELNSNERWDSFRKGNNTKREDYLDRLLDEEREHSADLRGHVYAWKLATFCAVCFALGLMIF
jgi:hypothetical protein